MDSVLLNVNDFLPTINGIENDPQNLEYLKQQIHDINATIELIIHTATIRTGKETLELKDFFQILIDAENTLKEKIYNIKKHKKVLNPELVKINRSVSALKTRVDIILQIRKLDDLAKAFKR